MFLFHMYIIFSVSEILEQWTKPTSPFCFILASCLFFVITKGPADRPTKLRLSWKVGPELIWCLRSDMPSPRKQPASSSPQKFKWSGRR